MKQFNWGAFSFTWIWGLNHNCYRTLWVLGVAVAAWMATLYISAELMYLWFAVAVIAQIVFSIWYGTMGTRWAWQYRNFASPFELKKVQDMWGGAGKVVAALAAAVLIMYTPLLIRLGLVIHQIRSENSKHEHFIDSSDSTTTSSNTDQSASRPDDSFGGAPEPASSSSSGSSTTHHAASPDTTTTSSSEQTINDPMDEVERRRQQESQEQARAANEQLQQLQGSHNALSPDPTRTPTYPYSTSQPRARRSAGF
jgi:hypothetical protein